MARVRCGPPRFFAAQAVPDGEDDTDGSAGEAEAAFADGMYGDHVIMGEQDDGNDGGSSDSDDSSHSGAGDDADVVAEGDDAPADVVAVGDDEAEGAGNGGVSAEAIGQVRCPLVACRVNAVSPQCLFPVVALSLLPWALRRTWLASC